MQSILSDYSIPSIVLLNLHSKHWLACILHYKMLIFEILKTLLFKRYMQTKFFSCWFYNKIEDLFHNDISPGSIDWMVSVLRRIGNIWEFKLDKRPTWVSETLQLLTVRMAHICISKAISLRNGIGKQHNNHLMQEQSMCCILIKQKIKCFHYMSYMTTP